MKSRKGCDWMERRRVTSLAHTEWILLKAQLKALLRKSNSARLAATITCSERAAAQMRKRTDSHLGRDAELLHSAKVLFFLIVIVPLTVSSARTPSCITDRQRGLNRPES